MRVNPKDRTCRECGGDLEIIDADDATMTVECQGECGEIFLVEPDAFRDGCVTYYVPFLATYEEARRMELTDECADDPS